MARCIGVNFRLYIMFNLFFLQNNQNQQQTELVNMVKGKNDIVKHNYLPYMLKTECYLLNAIFFNGRMLRHFMKMRGMKSETFNFARYFSA